MYILLITVTGIVLELMVFSSLAVAQGRMPAPEHSSDFNPEIVKINEDDYLGKTVPDIKITDAAGKQMPLSSFSGKPLLLLMIYYDCPNICPLLGEELADSLNQLGDLKAGKDYNVLVLSFNDQNGLADASVFREKVKEKTANPDVNSWVFAIAQEQDVNAITESTGYRFFRSSEDGLFVHPNVFIFLSPERKITRYIFGTNPAPFDMRMAIMESMDGKAGKVPLSSLVTFACYKYDSESGGYVVNLPRLFGLAGVFMAALTGGLSAIVYKKKKALNFN